MNLALKNVLAAIAFAAFCSPAPADTVNSFRHAHGLPPLHHSRTMQAMAQRHANSMAAILVPSLSPPMPMLRTLSSRQAHRSCRFRFSIKHARRSGGVGVSDSVCHTHTRFAWRVGSDVGL